MTKDLDFPLVKTFKFLSSKLVIPAVKHTMFISKAILAVVNNVYYIGHYHTNGNFYLFNNTGGIKIISSNPKDTKFQEVLWTYMSNNDVRQEEEHELQNSRSVG